MHEAQSPQLGCRQADHGYVKYGVELRRLRMGASGSIFGDTCIIGTVILLARSTN